VAGMLVLPRPDTSGNFVRFQAVAWAGIVASAMQGQRPGRGDGRTKKGVCRVADSPSSVAETYAAFAFFASFSAPSRNAGTAQKSGHNFHSNTCR
jgi:hypothetical protein